MVAQDLDHDGEVEVVLANGHIDMLSARTRDEPVRQPALLFDRGAEGRFADATAGAGDAFRPAYLGRGLARGDTDNDGDLDLLMVENNGPAHLWRNDTASKNRWIGLDCRLSAEGSPALGARVEVTAGSRTQVRWVRTDGSYLSLHDPRLQVGIGSADAAAVRVRWPDGRETEHRGLSAGRYWRLTPASEPRPL
jgi:hypothetical protein